VLRLALESSSYRGSVALLADWSILGERVVAMRGEHQERLLPAVAALLAEHRVSPSELSSIVCGAGPGSFTSLRVAAALAKGLAYALGVPLLAASSLLLIPASAEQPLSAGTYSAVLDAMRGEVFGVDFSVNELGQLTVDGDWWLAPLLEVRSRAAALGRRVVGPGEPEPILPRASGFARLGQWGMLRQVDVALWEPEYGRKAEAQVRWERAHGRPLG
jgi:tRNA threonylcarbamoyladenosine biosynthesis protein TsaB